MEGRYLESLREVYGALGSLGSIREPWDIYHP